MFAVAVGANVYGYVLVAGEGDRVGSMGGQSECSQLPNLLNSLFIVICVCVQLLNFNRQNSLLTTSFMCIYMSFWCFSSIYSSSKCHFTSSPQTYEKSDFYLIGTLTEIFWLLLSTFGSIFGSTNQIQADDEFTQQPHQVEYIELGETNHHQTSKNTIPQNNQ